MNASVPVLTFNDRVARCLDRVEYRLAVAAVDREAVFRLRYDGYLKDGGIAANETRTFSDAWDEVPNVLIFGVYLEGELASTVRVHVTSAGGREAPAFEPFADVLIPLSDQGHRLVDPTRFVINERFARIGAEIPFLTLRLTNMAAEYFGAYGILATVRQEHTIMYKRVVGHHAISEPRTYPLLKKPIVCMLVETTTLPLVAYRRHPFLMSTAVERERIFGSHPLAQTARIGNPALTTA
jgi:hypothetical protein